MLSKLFTLASLALAVNAEHWIFGGSRPIVTERLDSIVNPGGIGTHVHSVVGASKFSQNYDYDTLRSSKCTTIPVQPDKSNYWAPQAYYKDQHTGVLTPFTTGFNIYYLKRNGPKNQPVKAFPAGLRMVAGNPSRKVYNASNFEDQAVSYVCLDYSGAHNGDPDWAERPDFFDHTCPNGMRAQVFFPSCWDGKNLDSADHKSHMSYPIQNFNGGDCPDSHPVQLVSLFYEMFLNVQDFPYYGAGSWVFAMGDTTGLGHHGDFQNGWDVNLLQSAIDTCTNANGNVMDCPVLAAVFDQAAADACVIESEVLSENVGLDPAHPITVLPGCNPIWDGTGNKPACQQNDAIPSFVSAQEPLPSGWQALGCIAEGTNGRALASASTKSDNMTQATCASYCAAKGFKFAGVEFSDECYCGNSVANGASTNLINGDLCSTKCAGNANEMCGGAARLTLLTNSGVSASPAASSAASTSAASATTVATSSSAVTSSKATSSTKVASSTKAATSAVVTSSAAASSTTSNVAISLPTGGASNSTAAISGWTAAGCRQDDVNRLRTLNVDAFASNTMTLAACVAHCDSKGHTIAGLDAAAISGSSSGSATKTGAVLAAPTGSSSTCDSHAPAKRNHKRKAFGRMHENSDLF
ncbi:WSC-domain-containing protein [Epithele typhae]|uniref:WSC-domain-containing protein n=1 Tax=Epithele typhae TaxID=378194 RepID=UPI0020072C59|nr:WSC-domain-containing protein [Epithele typhae]KAH9912318.1 WSC-domain-containing protein [Epithele typhae]